MCICGTIHSPNRCQRVHVVAKRQPRLSHLKEDRFPDARCRTLQTGPHAGPLRLYRRGVTELSQAGTKRTDSLWQRELAAYWLPGTPILQGKGDACCVVAIRNNGDFVPSTDSPRQRRPMLRTDSPRQGALCSELALLMHFPKATEPKALSSRSLDKEVAAVSQE